ncbi:hypothetical protein UlMin_006182 [Ulmus minor]
MVHHLQVDPEHPPVRQKHCKFAPQRNHIINEEIQKLIDIGSVREVQYPDWLANVVVVLKKNGKWRVCIDFTDLNKACPKDSFPLPHIDMMVDATAGHELLSFMDAFSGYNQILMHPEDQEKTSFVMERGIFCYKVMPFGLKNAGATYQRLVNKMFSNYLGKTMEVYIDDMLVKSLSAEQHLHHLRQAFEVLKKYNMKLNPTKCSFGVSSGKFLGYMQIRSVLDILSPTHAKDVQCLAGRITALNRFISKSSERCHLFFFALLSAARKLRPYFQCHPIVVVTTYPLKGILQKPELSGRLTKWAVELSEYDISYQPRNAIKSQALADFIADFAPSAQAQANSELLAIATPPYSSWTLSVDGSSNMSGAGLGLVLISPEGDIIQQAIKCGFKATNNEAEYEALIAGLMLAKDMGIWKLDMISYLAHVKKLQTSFDEFNITQVPRLENTHADLLANLGSSVPATTSHTIPLVYLQWPVAWEKPPTEVVTVDSSGSWMTPILQYLAHDELPIDKNEARRLRAKAAHFTILDGQLLQRSFSGPYLKCVTPSEANYILAELHEGECGNHSGGRSLAN